MPKPPLEKETEQLATLTRQRQNAQAALKIADRAYVMELGEFILDGPAAEISANQRVVASYLGIQHEGTSAI